jgi:cytochrome P450
VTSKNVVRVTIGEQPVSLLRQSLFDKKTYGDPRFQAGMYSVYRELRETSPISHDRGVACWLLTRYADVAAAYADPLFSVASAPSRSDRTDLERHRRLSVVSLDPPQHGPRRRWLARDFYRALDRARPAIQVTVDDLVDALPPHGPVDLVPAICDPLPLSALAALMGCPTFAAPDLRGAAKRCIGEQWPSVWRPALAWLGTTLHRLGTQHRARPQPGLLSALVTAPDAPEPAQVVAQLTWMISPSQGNGVAALGNSVAALLEHPDQLALLRARPELLGSAIEECLRYDGPAQVDLRRATADTVIGGQRIRAGAWAALMNAAANHDPAQFPDPDRFDVTRTPNRHLAFGAGPHSCLGAPLMRTQLATVIETLLRRLPGLRLAAGHPPAWVPSATTRQRRHLWADYDEVGPRA